jgi:hypothetical protein
MDQDDTSLKKNEFDKITSNLDMFKTNQPDPCAFQPVGGSSRFKYDPTKQQKHCHNNHLASVYVSIWENESEGKVKPADLNNIACAYLWREKPDWERAYALFVAARLSIPEGGSEEDPNGSAATSGAVRKPDLPIDITLLKNLEFLKNMDLKGLDNYLQKFREMTDDQVKLQKK